MDEDVGLNLANKAMTTMKKQRYISAQIQKGAQHLYNRDYQKAADTFSEILNNHDSKSALAYGGIAQLCFDTGNKRMAMKFTHDALDCEPENVAILQFAVFLALHFGKFNDAKRYATKAYKLAPKAADGIKAYLLYLSSIGDVSKVERLARELLALDKSTEARLTAGTALETAGRIPEAIRIYRNAIADVVAANSPPPHTKGGNRP